MTYGNVIFMGQTYEVKGEFLNLYVQPARKTTAMRAIIDWVSKNNVFQLASSSQIRVIEGDMISCRLHENLEDLINVLDFDIEYLDFELDPVLMIIHIRVQII